MRFLIWKLNFVSPAFGGSSLIIHPFSDTHFLKGTFWDKYPLSIFLSKINAQEIGLAFAAACFYMIPCLLMYIYGEEQLVEGIAYQDGVKG